MHVFVDADACPVKQEVYRVARRYNLEVTLVANSWMRIPKDDLFLLKVVPNQPDAADDWIVDEVKTDDLVITTDIPLADRCLAKGVHVLNTSGKPFTVENIGQALATRGLLTELRSMGEKTGGPPPITRKDRSRFLQEMDRIIQAVRLRHK